MIGWMMLRGARAATRGGRSKPKVDAPSWNEIAKDRTGQWAILIFATMFIGAVVFIGWFINHANNVGH